MGMMLLRFVLLSVLVSPLTANSQGEVPACCGPESAKLSQSQVGALVEKTEPIQAPCCAGMLHINGTVVLTISVDAKGNVTCVQMVSGHPLIVGVAIDSVRHWTFQPYGPKGAKKSFCGQVALRFQVNESGVKYKIV
jgi:outer membrane biosynthesis protein TonB